MSASSKHIITEFFLFLSYVPIVVTTIYMLAIYRKAGRELKAFSPFLFVSCFIQLISLALGLLKINNLPLLHVYVALGFLCLGYFYNTVLEGFVNKRIIWAATALFLLFTILNSLLLQPVFTFNSYALTIESLLVIILSLFTYMLLLNDIVKERRKDSIKSINWINSGLFIYYFSSLVIFYYGEMIIRVFTADFNRYTWVIHSILSMIMYTCFFVGLWKQPKS